MKKITAWLILIVVCTLPLNLEAAKKKKPRFKPYYLASTQVGEFTKAVDDTRALIKQSSFQLVGDYSPYENAHLFILTNAALLNAAAQSEFGGYGAVIRVSVTATEKGNQVSYVNPVYMTNLYHIPEVPEVAADLAKIFGEGKTYGSKKGKSKRSLKKYQYMVFMPKFDDHDKLGKFDSHEQALATVNGNLASGNYKLNKVFEVTVPGKDEVLIGVAIGEGEGADSTIMPIVDSGKLKHTPHLPYAVLVSGNKVYSQAGKFRIASSFPDLGMGTFMKISDAPGGIKKSLRQLTKK